MKPLPVLPALKRACQEFREDLGVTRSEIAGHLRKAESAIWRFENPDAGWPSGAALDDTVAAYAEKCGTTPRAIWERALNLAEAELTEDAGSRDAEELDQAVADVEEAYGDAETDDGEDAAALG